MDTSKPAGGGREDCWSEGSTAVLIEAWGERHLRCNRGNLRQNDWKEVSDAVNRQETAAGKPSKTDVQCKNRIDTLKKKYKIEKAKPSPSNWPFFNRLDFLIGPPKGGVSPPTPAVNFSAKNPNPNPNPNANSNLNAKLRFSSVESSESSLDDEELMMGVVGRGKKHRLENGGSSSSMEEEKAALRELARAVVKFGEIYERIESSKQQQIMELEKQRMEFTKELELQRMNMLVEAQLEIEKLKRSKYGAAAAGKNL